MYLRVNIVYGQYFGQISFMKENSPHLMEAMTKELCSQYEGDERSMHAALKLTYEVIINISCAFL